MDKEIFNEFREILGKMDAQLREFALSNPSAQDACEVLSEINFLKRDLAIVYDAFAFVVPDLMGNVEKMTLPDGTQIEKSSSYDRRKWQHKELGSAVADKLIKSSIDMDTGEMTKSTREIAMEMLQYCAPSYWRVKELNKLGINPDNYCETGELRNSIIVRKTKDQ